VLAAIFGRDYVRWDSQPINAGKFLLIVLGGLIVTAVIHSFWGMFISMSEDIHDILYYVENSAQRKPSVTNDTNSDGIYQSSANRYANESSSALQKLQNINNGGSPDAHSVSPVDILRNETAAGTPRTTPPESAPQAAPVSQVKPETPLTPWTCRNCGETNPGDAKYCGHCGLFK